ncbi:MAG: fasciclin domain-containing protein [Paludibacter sp.]|nr:fasciclin domain-containing protein [Paludibacter sp.]
MKHNILISIGLILLMSGCLGIQEDYEYTPSNKSNVINMNVWDFIKSRPDVFSEFRDAVRKSGIDSTIYISDSTRYTYLILDNNAMSTLTATLGAISNSNQAKWINVLKYHIIDGYYHGLGVLTFDPTPVITLWRSQDAYMTLQLESKNSFNYSRLIVNGLDPAWSSLTSTYKYAVTSNLMCTNGICHVLNRHARPVTNNNFN